MLKLLDMAVKIKNIFLLKIKWMRLIIMSSYESGKYFKVSIQSICLYIHKNINSFVHLEILNKKYNNNYLIK